MALTAIATFRTSSEFKERIDTLARETKRSAGFFYNLLLEEHLDELEDIYLGQKVLEEIRSGKMKTYAADDVYKEFGL